MTTVMINDMYYLGLASYPEPYGVDSPDLRAFDSWADFAQILWAPTERVGCAVQYCPAGVTNTEGRDDPYFTACNYSPLGVIMGQLSNVHEPTGAPSVEFKP
ncbi:hypothetical protein F4820DRAFT_424351 [Hypoxylon rubiginosum]|uniref:Uncharacterized protein n=1 Tax=Hypoxylon rubiginosum TaxID=110542 RepID=A0ACB9YYV4_9PEZI|nr:hypothetical protein F4820DRAFT_424351 [Hypoxylon rubiginosum]